MFALEAYRLYKDYDEGYLFPMRNLTFFIVCLSFVALPVLGIYGMVTGSTLGAANTLLVPVFLWLIINNLFYVRLDSVGIASKSGFFTSKYVPLFEITEVKESDGSLVVSQAEGPDIRSIAQLCSADELSPLEELQQCFSIVLGSFYTHTIRAGLLESAFVVVHVFGIPVGIVLTDAAAIRIDPLHLSGFCIASMD